METTGCLFSNFLLEYVDGLYDYHVSGCPVSSVVPVLPAENRWVRNECLIDIKDLTDRVRIAC